MATGGCVVRSAGVESERVRSSREAAACSVHAEMAIVCCGDRLPWEASGRSFGWMAMIEPQEQSKVRIIVEESKNNTCVGSGQRGSEADKR